MAEKVGELEFDLRVRLDRIDQDLRSAETKITRASAQMEAGFSRVTAGVRTLQRVLGTIGVTATAAGFVQLIRSSLDFADQLQKVSAQTGVAVEALQELRFAGSQVGLQSEEIDQALAILQQRIGDIAREAKGPAAEALNRLGISLKGIENREVESVLLEIVRQFQQLESGAEQAAVAGDIFTDRVGRRLLPVLKLGVQGLEDLRGSFEGVVPEESIRRVAEAESRLRQFADTIRGRLVVAIDEALPVLRNLFEFFSLEDPGFGALRNFSDLSGRLREVNAELVKTEESIARLSETGGGAAAARLQPLLDRLRKDREDLQRVLGIGQPISPGRPPPSLPPAGTVDLSRQLPDLDKLKRQQEELDRELRDSIRDRAEAEKALAKARGDDIGARAAEASAINAQLDEQIAKVRQLGEEHKSRASDIDEIEGNRLRTAELRLEALNQEAIAQRRVREEELRRADAGLQDELLAAEQRLAEATGNTAAVTRIGIDRIVLAQDERIRQLKELQELETDPRLQGQIQQQIEDVGKTAQANIEALKAESDEFGQALRDAFDSIPGVLAGLITRGEFTFRSLGESFLQEFVRRAIAGILDVESALSALKAAGGGLLGLLGGGGVLSGGIFSGILGAEGGIATKPTLGVFGEAGPEALIPLDRLSSLSSPRTVVQVFNSTGQPSRVDRSNTGGLDQFKIFIGETAVQAVAADIGRRGTTAQAIEQRFGSESRPTR